MLRIRAADDEGPDAPEDAPAWNLQTLGPDAKMSGQIEAEDHSARTMCWIVAAGRVEVADALYREWPYADVYRAYATQRAVEYRPPRKRMQL